MIAGLFESCLAMAWKMGEDGRVEAIRTESWNLRGRKGQDELGALAAETRLLRRRDIAWFT